MKLETKYTDSRMSGLIWLSAIGLLGMPLLFAGGVHLFDKLPALGLFMMLLTGVGVAGGILGLAKSGRAKSGVVDITREGVDFGTTSLKREDIVTAAFRPATGRSPMGVRLAGKNDRELAWITVRDHAEADAILAALGMAPEQTSAQFWAMSKFGSPSSLAFLASFVLSMGIGIAFGALFKEGAAAMVALVPMIAAMAYFNPASVHVGSDGILHKMRLGSKFMAWRDVLRMEASPGGIGIYLKNGEYYDIKTTSRGKVLYDYERVAQATLVARANEMHAKFNRGEVPDVSARVARLGRTKEAWIASLSDREGSFRDAPIRDDDLWTIVESPGAELTARAGAAAVLSQDASEDDRVRLRVAAETCAEPRLRVVLDKAAAGGDVMEALAEVEDEPQTLRA